MTTPKITGTKADLTLPEVRAAFILQYHGQNVVPVTGPSLFAPLHIDDLPGMILHGNQLPLSLRHISSLTDEELREFVLQLLIDVIFEFNGEFVAMNFSESDGGYCQVEWKCTSDSGIIHMQLSDEKGIKIHATTTEEEYNYPLNYISGFDYLRSIGILIPYRGNSCEEIIAAGLAVYAEEKEGA